MFTLIFLVSFALLAVCAVPRREIDWSRVHQISHDTFFLGEHRHPLNASRRVHGYAFAHPAHSDTVRAEQRRFADAKVIHFSRIASASPHDRRLGRLTRAQFSACARPIAAGVRWRTSRGFFLNSHNRQGLSADYLERATMRAVERWQCVLGGAQQRLVLGPLLDVRLTRSGDDMNLGVPDGRSEVGLGTIRDRPGTIALTVLWGIFEGPVEQRELIEFDMIFDESNYVFGNASAVMGVIDYESTATHEFGHAHGLDDIYEDACSDVTMFGTSARDETHKRTLEMADTDAVLELYN